MPSSGCSENEAVPQQLLGSTGGGGSRIVVDSKSSSLVVHENDNRISDNDDDNNDTTDSRSISSQDEALCDVLGLSSLHMVTLTLQQEEKEEEEKEQVQVQDFCDNNDCKDSAPTVHSQPIRLPLPKNVSRYFYPPHQCCAWTIPNLFTKQECQDIIDIAAHANSNGTLSSTSPSSSQQQQQSSSSSSFQYVTMATHTANDGSQYSVKLQTPNPHKLSVFHHPQWVHRLWERIQPYTQQQQQQQQDPSSSSSSSTSSTSILHDMMKRDRLIDHQESQILPVRGLNPRLRVLKYDADDNDEFLPHFDATTTTTTTTTTTNMESTTDNTTTNTSLVTVLLYLNDGGGIDFEGGETVFLSNTVVITETKNPSRTVVVEEEERKKITTTTTTTKSSTNHKAGSIKIHVSENATVLTPTTGTVVLFEHDLYHCGKPLIWGTKYVLRTDIMFEMTLDEVQTLRNSRQPPSPLQINNNNNNDDDDDDDDDGTDNSQPVSSTAVTTTTTTMTMQELVDKVFDDDDDDSKSQNNNNNNTAAILSDHRESIIEALLDLGLLEDTSIETFCSPGRFALQAMLQDVIRCVPTNDKDNGSSSSSRTNHRDTIRAINSLLDAAFTAARP
ncbi:2(OG)-Fe(II) oxygenase superfamily protein [Nitzschia inconspicua]|uniref:2(OG)-Fe(II) oxygenase superfamily protein n=1 Tax=Nitzschia inconspicua TaxID=303405 RepID=A0A9K3Q1T8_9STRA|nr:2OG-Fe(II) oxygenase superfamily-domain containing protein [Nitzschia inconspicua]KAG7367858.1 2(OG)-Fe(II) oxygenase superfamily protein [Nitzschia inconspicua]